MSARLGLAALACDAMRVVPKALLLLVLCALGACARAPRELAQDRAPACAGLTEADVAAAVATLRSSVASVESHYEQVSYPKGSPAQRLDGAVIHVRATPGLTAPWLTRVLGCHLAARDVTVRTTETSAGFAVLVASTDPAGGRAVVERSRSLAPSP